MFGIHPIVSLGSCFLLASIYVSSLYIWRSEHNRDHPATVKKRTFSVFLVMLVSPIFIYLTLNDKLPNSTTIWNLMGFRWAGLHFALVLPLCLTILLFLGPISIQLYNKIWIRYLDKNYWIGCFTNILWLRNHVIAPLSEEFTFRACMMPLLLQSFTTSTAIAITPLFFGVPHLHHIIERLKTGMEWKNVIIISVFQLTYTTIFGWYSAYLFARTGHFIVPFIVHAFCNHMGFPDIEELINQPKPMKQIFIFLYFFGFISWLYLLPFATDPVIYSNQLFYT